MSVPVRLQIESGHYRVDSVTKRFLQSYVSTTTAPPTYGNDSDTKAAHDWAKSLLSGKVDLSRIDRVKAWLGGWWSDSKNFAREEPGSGGEEAAKAYRHLLQLANEMSEARVASIFDDINITFARL